MALTPGIRLGAFQLVDLIGRGGMGEVYRATDTSLGRQVAIKVLPEAFAQDAERLARFEREAKTLASLNHPNIAAIHAIEKSGGVTALVMELVEGDDLSQRIARGAIPVDEALPLAKQIAEALEAAHEQGIIHRDLKPANIKVRPDGTVKVLDFGLAKAMEPGAGSSPSMSMAPTITTPAMTQAGMILGTAAYMSPEQAKGRPVDKRSDVWSFGAVLYEMLTGRRAFEAEDVSETLAAVLMRAPDWTRMPANLPVGVRTLLQGCLERERRQRIGDMAAALFVMNNAGSLSAAVIGAPAPVGPPSRRRAALALVLTAAGTLAGVSIGAGVWRQPAPDPPPAARFSFRLPSGQLFTTLSPRMVAVSPDGSQLVYHANSRLYRRPVGELQPTEISGSLQWAPSDVAFAPDGQAIAFYSRADRAVMRVPLRGGTPTMVGRTETPLGMSWSADGIVVGQGEGGVIRFRVADGGAPGERIVQVGDDDVAASPQMLPDGNAVLFTLAPKGASGGEQWDKARVVIQSLTTGERHVVVEGASDARYVPTGHLVYAVAGTVVAAAFDLGARRVTGEPVTMVEGVRRSPETGVAQMAMSDSGTLLYVPGAATWMVDDLRTFAVTNRAGAPVSLPLPPGPYDHPRVSGRQMAFVRSDQQAADVWIYDLDGAAAVRRLTLEGRNRFPVWSPDGSRVALQSDREADLGIFVQDVRGAAAPERLTKPEADDAHIPESWSPDGKHLLFSVRRGASFALWIVSLEDKKSAPFGDVVSMAGPPGAVFSPDGRWVAYTINEAVASPTSLNRGVFVQPFPATGQRFQVPKTRFDYHPTWAPDGKTLFYNTGASDSIAAVTVRTDSAISFGSPTRIAPTSRVVYSEARGYDILPDGRFVSVVPAPGTVGGLATDSPELRVVINWFEELKRLVPVK